jgi:hypothetical protein
MHAPSLLILYTFICHARIDTLNLDLTLAPSSLRERNRHGGGAEDQGPAGGKA